MSASIEQQLISKMKEVLVIGSEWKLKKDHGTIYTVAYIKQIYVDSLTYTWKDTVLSYDIRINHFLRDWEPVT